MFSLLVVVDGNNSIHLNVDSNMQLGKALSIIPNLKDKSNSMVIIYDHRVLDITQTIDELGIPQDSRIIVYTHPDQCHYYYRKKLTDQIDDITMEAVKIMDSKIDRILDEPRVVSLCNNFFQNEEDEVYHAQHEVYDPTLFPREKLKHTLSTEPLPMVWKTEQQLDIFAEPQEPTFSSVTEAREFYSNQLTEHGWNW